MFRIPAILLLCTLVGIFSGRADATTFPPDFIPFTSIDYVTAPDANGNQLVFGESYDNQLLAMWQFLGSMTTAGFPGEMYSNTQIELAPGQFFSGVYVPTFAHKTGDFSDFNGQILDPWFAVNGTAPPFPLGIIPTSMLGYVYAFEINPSAVSTSPVPEPASLFCVALGLSLFLLWRNNARHLQHRR